MLLGMAVAAMLSLLTGGCPGEVLASALGGLLLGMAIFDDAGRHDISV